MCRINNIAISCVCYRFQQISLLCLNSAVELSETLVSCSMRTPYRFAACQFTYKLNRLRRITQWNGLCKAMYNGLYRKRCKIVYLFCFLKEGKVLNG